MATTRGRLTPPHDPTSDDGDEGGSSRWLVLRDVREQQPDERLQTDGVQDHPCMFLVGSEPGLLVHFVTGVLTPPETEEPYTIYLGRERLKEVWPFLTHWIETGEWKPDEEPPLPPFPKEV